LIIIRIVYGFRKGKLIAKEIHFWILFSDLSENIVLRFSACCSAGDDVWPFSMDILGAQTAHWDMSDYLRETIADLPTHMGL